MRVLEILHDRTMPVTEEELAARVARSSGAGTAPTTSREEAHVRLRHVDLPKLADAGLVAWDEDDGTVTAAAYPPPYDGTGLHDSAFGRVDEREDDEGTAVAVNVPEGRRGAVLTILESRNAPQRRDDLAREVAAREADGEPSTEVVEEVQVTLHHVHLPKLDDAGLIDYDADEGMVSATDHGGLR